MVSDVNLVHPYSKAAMMHGIQNSDAVIVLLSPTYFARPFCVKEMAWCVKYDKPVLPCVPVKLKENIGQFGGYPARAGAQEMEIAVAPAFLKSVLSINVDTLDRSDIEYLRVGVKKLQEAQRKTIPVVLEEGQTVDGLTQEALANMGKAQAEAAAKKAKAGNNDEAPWDYFISHVQAETEALAADIYGELRQQGLKVWLDVKMKARDEVRRCRLTSG